MKLIILILTICLIALTWKFTDEYAKSDDALVVLRIGTACLWIGIVGALVKK